MYQTDHVDLDQLIHCDSSTWSMPLWASIMTLIMTLIINMLILHNVDLHMIMMSSSEKGSTWSIHTCTCTSTCRNTLYKSCCRWIQLWSRYIVAWVLVTYLPVLCQCVKFIWIVGFNKLLAHFYHQVLTVLCKIQILVPYWNYIRH